jgi:hypothetical protein
LLLFHIGVSSKYFSIGSRRSLEAIDIKGSLAGAVGLVGLEWTMESMVSCFFLYYPHILVAN